VVHREEASPVTAADSPVVMALLEAMKAIYGLEGRAGGVGGGTVARCLRMRGIPAVVWARVLDNCHVPNETARLSHAVGDAQVCAHMLFTG